MYTESYHSDGDCGQQEENGAVVGREENLASAFVYIQWSFRAKFTGETLTFLAIELVLPEEAICVPVAHQRPINAYVVSAGKQVQL